MIVAQRASEQVDYERPRQDSNLGTRFRKPMLYPLSYEGGRCDERGDERGDQRGDKPTCG